jgi:hypothetical protein
MDGAKRRKKAIKGEYALCYDSDEDAYVCRDCNYPGESVEDLEKHCEKYNHFPHTKEIEKEKKGYVGRRKKRTLPVSFLEEANNPKGKKRRKKRGKKKSTNTKYKYRYRSHEKVYYCEEPGCKYTSLKLKALSSHCERMNHKPYEESEEKTGSQYDKHLKSDGEYECPCCDDYEYKPNGKANGNNNEAYRKKEAFRKHLKRCQKKKKRKRRRRK